MSSCTLSSFNRVLEAGHPFIPDHPDAVEGLYIPARRPINLPEPAAPSPGSASTTMNDIAFDEASEDANVTTQNVVLAEILRPETEATQALVQPAPMADPAFNDVNGDAFADAPAVRVEAIIMEYVFALVAALRRLFPVRAVERWLRSIIRMQWPARVLAFA